MPEYRQGTARGGQQFSAVTGFLNLKRQFEDAKRQQAWKQDQDWRNSQTDMIKQRTSTAGQLAGNGMMSPQQFESATSYSDPYSGQQVQGMQISETDRQLSPSLQNARDKRIESLLTKVETGNTQRASIADAFNAAKKINSGIYGKVGRGWARNLDPNNPGLEDWQKVKIVLLDANLMNTARTKGAISDREFSVLQDAAANDDVTSLPRILPVLKRVMNFVNDEETGALNTFKKVYKEDPSTWEEFNSNKEQYKDMDFNYSSKGKKQSNGVTSSGNSFKRIQ